MLETGQYGGNNGGFTGRAPKNAKKRPDVLGNQIRKTNMKNTQIAVSVMNKESKANARASKKPNNSYFI